MSTNERVRGRALQTRRRKWFARDPLCKRCKDAGRVSLAVDLDHVVPIEHGGADDESNLQGLCGPCHAEKTAEDRHYKPRVQIGLDGFPMEVAA